MKEQRTAATLRRLPLRVAFEWVSKTVTTDPPRYTPHLEWRLELRLVASAPLQVAVMLENAAETAWGLSPDPPTAEALLCASFSPYSWADSDDVQINFGWQRYAITDPALKHDPRQVVQVVAPEEAETGTELVVATVPAHALTLSVLPVAATDIEPRRNDRWRLNPRLAAALPPHLQALTSGRQSGVVRRS